MLIAAFYPVAAAAENITMNFKDADIQSVIQFVAEFSGKNFLVDSRVKGNVTIISPKAIPEKAAYDVFLSILEINGFTAIESGDVIKILPLADAKQQGVAVNTYQQSRGSDRLVTQVITLNYADATKLVAILRPLMSPQSHLVAHASGNLLLLTDMAQSVRKLTEIVEVLDASELLVTELVPLRFASAEKMEKTLKSVYKVTDQSNAFRIMAYNPGNVMILSGTPSAIAEIKAMIVRLDYPPEHDAGRMSVRYLQHADAEDVAKVLTPLVAQTEKSPSIFVGEVKVVADKATNALLITADPSDRDALYKIIDKLDIRRLQVLVEALIVEVSENVAQQFGVEWQAMSNVANGNGIQAIGGTSFPNNAGVNINTVAANPFAGGAGLMVGAVKGTVTFGGVTFANLGALMRALDSNSDTNILSTPNLLTMDNEEAEIIIGQNVPFITGQSATQGGVANPFQTIERKDVGLTLRVKPQISAGDSLRLDIYQEVSSVQGGTAAEGGFITNKRSIKTSVLADDKNIIVLGGLIKDDNAVSVQQVPCLGGIPFLGEPFKFTQNTRVKTNLMVFLRPHIIKQQNDIDTLTQEKYLDIRTLYENPKKRGSLVFPQEKQQLPADLSPLTPVNP
ncbi:MAG: type II secretion system secretin GspD [Zetaproteobacteria bacterium]|nr:type II secretion system secretin GspD [Zetaproteobacteria bacterium]